jgi:hypothetical protein
LRNDLPREIFAPADRAASTAPLASLFGVAAWVFFTFDKTGDWGAGSVDRCSTGCILIGPLDRNLLRVIRDNSRVRKWFVGRFVRGHRGIVRNNRGTCFSE